MSDRYAITSYAALSAAKLACAPQKPNGNSIQILHNLPCYTLCEDDQNIVANLRSTSKDYLRLDPTTLYAVSASTKLQPLQEEQRNRTTLVSLGSSRGATHSFENALSDFAQQKRLISTTSPTTTLGNVSSSVLKHLDLCGTALSCSMTCSTSLLSIGNALAWLRANMADQALVGGSEAPLTDFTLEMMRSLGIYSGDTSSPYPCRPLAIEERNTFTLGEGAAVMLIERESQALSPPLAIISSCGFATEKSSGKSSVGLTGEGITQAMQAALQEAALCTKDIDAVMMHAPGTKQGDSAELRAICDLFGEDSLPFLFSNKWLLGHTLGASGALSIGTAMEMFSGSTPQFPYPTRIKEQKLTNTPSHILINSAGFGGIACSVVLSHPSILPAPEDIGVL